VGKPGNGFNVIGWSQGTFRIRRDSHTGAETVTPDSSEIPVYDPAAQGFTKTGCEKSAERCFRSARSPRSASSHALREQHYSRAEKIGEVARSCLSEGEESQVVQQSAAMRNILRKLGASVVALLYGLWSVVAAHGYAFNEIVPDVRQPSNISGGSAALSPPKSARFWMQIFTSIQDLESILTHELGHAFGFSHSAVWSAMTFPFAPAPGTYSGVRPSAQVPDAPLADDDPTGLRVLYPDPSDTVYVGSIQGYIVPANPISLPASPPGVTGVFRAHVVAVDATSGSVIAGSMGGWSCAAPGPVQFDGNYEIDRLPVGRSYKVYAEPLDGTVAPSEASNALVTLCRNATTDPGWPPLQGRIVPSVDTAFTTRTRP
jgi:hypothetical protein